ncbi:GAF domain-containing protein [Candidatus Desantisbacteria bacterium]|nr:GAF domain-containing protein [Candidatus Desantisbacteria bacterium]
MIMLKRDKNCFDNNSVYRSKKNIEYKKQEPDIILKKYIIEHFPKITNDDIYNNVLGIILNMMQSKFGIFGYIDKKGAIVCPSIIKYTCRKQTLIKNYIVPLRMWDSIWSIAMIEKISLYSNHILFEIDNNIKINGALAVPIIYQDECLGNFFVANKETKFNEKDKILLENIANYIAPFMYIRKYYNNSIYPIFKKIGR